MAKSNKTRYSFIETVEKTEIPADIAKPALVEKPEVKKVTIGKLVSRVKFPVNIVYKGENIRMSPKAIFENMDRSLLKETPLGVIFVPYNK